jgi:predicted O-linked N-acetylglucosamine transferase (SPINDLY family)
VRHTDWLTDQLKARADVWRSTIDLSDERLAQLIRDDKIDVLVDLTMHMRGSRLLAFARKPAPVQVPYLAYAGTTGLEVMDYRMSDPYLDPLPIADFRLPNEEMGYAGVVPFSREPFYSEKTARLRSYWCYQPSERAPQSGEPPAIANGHVTLGCLNNFSKVNVHVLNAWARILAQVPDSKLLLYAPQGKSRHRVEAFLSQQNVDPRRLQFVDLTLPVERYLEHYRQVDIALDPFPYPGGTTSCDALWMGVPLVTLAGRTAISRSGLSILSNMGLAELVATEVEQYIRLATELAGNAARLSDLRATLRDRMRSSPLMDPAGFAKDVEAAYRAMWRAWCGSGM